MSEQPDTDASGPTDRGEPAGSPQRRLVEQVQPYEVDPPAPPGVRTAD